MNEVDVHIEDSLMISFIEGTGLEADRHVTEHLSRCLLCQSRLEALAAESTEWSFVKESLSAGSILDTQSGSDGRLDAKVRSYFSAPSHPEMLGRLGRYEVEKIVGNGGMGIVFKAYDTELHRSVAIKFLAPHLAENKTARQRFAREARAAAAVVNDHVVPIYNVEEANAKSYLVMQYIAGDTLQAKLDRDGPLEAQEIVRIGMQVSSGLAAAHAQGLIHRDVKPSNILLDEIVSRAMLSDFGLARMQDEADVTRTGCQVGTPHYMSPEQVRGVEIDQRSDLFSLGCVLYTVCTGNSPFQADNSFAVMSRIREDSPESICKLNPSIPKWLEAIVMRLLEKKPDDRYQSAQQLVSLFEQCAAHLSCPQSSPLPDTLQILSSHSRGGSRGFKRWVTAAAVALPVLLFGILFVLETSKGTIRIESDANDVPIRITKSGHVVERLTVNQKGSQIRVAGGEYLVELENKDGRLEVQGDRVTVSKGKDTLVKIVWDESTRPAVSDTQVPASTTTYPIEVRTANPKMQDDIRREVSEQLNFIRQELIGNSAFGDLKWMMDVKWIVDLNVAPHTSSPESLVRKMQFSVNPKGILEAIHINVHGAFDRIIDSELPNQIRIAVYTQEIGGTPNWVRSGYGLLRTAPDKSKRLFSILGKVRQQEGSIGITEHFLTNTQPQSIVSENSEALNLCLYSFFVEHYGHNAIAAFSKEVITEPAKLSEHLQACFGINSIEELNVRLDDWLEKRIQLVPMPRPQFDSPDATISQSFSPAAIVMVMHPGELRNGNTIQREAAQKMLELLSPEDYLGVLIYDGKGETGTNWLWGSGPELKTIGTNRKEWTDLVAQSSAGDFPFFDSAFEKSLIALRDAKAQNKLLLMLTDGDAVIENVNWPSQFRDARIKVSVIQVDIHRLKQVSQLKEITQATGGIYHYALESQSASVSSFFEKELHKMRIQSGTQLRKIGEAFHEFHAKNNRFPESRNFLRDRNNQAFDYPYSWRVALLPYLGEQTLFDEYRFDEPWDSERNLLLMARMPAIFRSQDAPLTQPIGHTNMQGLESVLNIKSTDTESQQVFANGMSKTVLVLETAQTVPWTKPQDLSDAVNLSFAGRPLSFLLADGSVGETRVNDVMQLQKMLEGNGQDFTLPNRSGMSEQHAFPASLQGKWRIEQAHTPHLVNKFLVIERNRMSVEDEPTELKWIGPLGGGWWEIDLQPVVYDGANRIYRGDPGLAVVHMEGDRLTLFLPIDGKPDRPNPVLSAENSSDRKIVCVRDRTLAVPGPIQVPPDEAETLTVRLESTSATTVTKALQDYCRKQNIIATVAADTPQNAIVIVAGPKDMAELEKVIKALDSADKKTSEASDKIMGLVEDYYVELERALSYDHPELQVLREKLRKLGCEQHDFYTGHITHRLDYLQTQRDSVALRENSDHPQLKEVNTRLQVLHRIDAGAYRHILQEIFDPEHPKTNAFPKEWQASWIIHEVKTSDAALRKKYIGQPVTVSYEWMTISEVPLRRTEYFVRDIMTKDSNANIHFTIGPPSEKPDQPNRKALMRVVDNELWLAITNNDTARSIESFEEVFAKPTEDVTLFFLRRQSELGFDQKLESPSKSQVMVPSDGSSVAFMLFETEDLEFTQKFAKSPVQLEFTSDSFQRLISKLEQQPNSSVLGKYTVELSKDPQVVLHRSVTSGAEYLWTTIQIGLEPQGKVALQWTDRFSRGDFSTNRLLLSSAMEDSKGLVIGPFMSNRFLGPKRFLFIERKQKLTKE